MSGLSLFEIHDCSWCPRVIRDALTDFLQVAIEFQDTYGSIRKSLFEAISTSGATQVIDLCSGAGGPWVSWRKWQYFRRPVFLTDKYPNVATAERLEQEFGEGLRYHPAPVDATEWLP